MKKVIAISWLLLALLITTAGCRRKQYRDGIIMDESSYKDQRQAYEEERSIRKGTKVYMEQSGGVYLVPITVNGLHLNFIFDTGASSICLSAAEATVMVRQGKITEDDILGQQQFQDATGGVSVGTIVRLRTVDIGGIVLHDVEANVVDNIQAPLLLGQTALSKFGRVTIDYNNNTIEFN